MSRRSLLLLGVTLLLLGGYIAVFECGRPDPGDSRHQRRVFGGIDARRVTRIVLERPGQERIELRRQGALWQMLAPEPGPADLPAVRKLLSAVEFVEYLRVLPAGIGRRQLGLHAPRLRLELVGAGVPGSPARLELGSVDVSGTGVYVARGARLLLVPREFATDVNLEPAQLRDRDLLPFVANEVTRVEIVRDTDGLLLEREHRHWTVREAHKHLASSARVRAQSAKVYQLVGSLSALRATRVLPAATVTGARVRVGAGKRRRELIVGGGCPDRSRERLVAVVGPSVPMRVCVEADDLAPLDVTVGELQDRALTRATEADLSQIVIARPSGTVELIRDGADWRVNGAVAEGDEIRRWVADLARLDGEIEVGQGSDPFRHLALGDVATLTLRYGPGDVDVVRFGAAVGHRVPVQRGRASAILWLSPQVLELVTAPARRFHARAAPQFSGRDAK